MKFKWLQASSLLIALTGCHANNDNRLTDGQVTESLFAEETALAMTISGPIRQIFSEKEEFPIFDADQGQWEQAYRAGTLTIGGTAIAVKLRARGQGTRSGCSFPPFKIKFKASDVRNTPFQGLR